MIYFDNAATTPPIELKDDRGNKWGNPSSPHRLGLEAERAVKAASQVLGNFLRCDPDGIIYTSGGTESNNLALLGVARRFKRRGGHILSTAYEHPSVVQPLRHLADEGFSVTYAPPSEWPGLVREDTFLASLMQVNNETGDINDIASVAAQVKAVNPHIVFHVDGVQGFGKEKFMGEYVDLYSFSAHKCHGPASVGGLAVKPGIKLTPLLYGGGQQNTLRPGTENVPGICALANIIQEIGPKQDLYREQVMAVRTVLVGLADDLPEVFVNTMDTGAVSPYILNMSFIGVRGETLVHALSERAVYISMGAACHTRKKDKPPLHIMGFNDARVSSAVRFSFSCLNTVAEAETVRAMVINIVKQIRAHEKE